MASIADLIQASWGQSAPKIGINVESSGQRREREARIAQAKTQTAVAEAQLAELETKRQILKKVEDARGASMFTDPTTGERRLDPNVYAANLEARGLQDQAQDWRIDQAKLNKELASKNKYQLEANQLRVQKVANELGILVDLPLDRQIEGFRQWASQPENSNYRLTPNEQIPQVIRNLVLRANASDYAHKTALKKFEKGLDPKKGNARNIELPNGSIIAGIENEDGTLSVNGEPAPPNSKLASAPTVQIGQEKEKTKLYYKAYEGLREEASRQEAIQYSLEFISHTLEGVATGRLTDWRKALGQLGASFGIHIDKDLASLEAAEAGMGKLVMSVLGEFKGAISDGERQFAATIVPKLTQTPAGREEITRFLSAVADRSQKKLEMFWDHKDVVDFDKAWGEYVKKNPIMDKAKMEQLTENETPVEKLTDEQKNELRIW